MKKITALLLCFALLFTTALAVDYSEAETVYTRSDILQIFEKLMTNRGIKSAEESVDTGASSGYAYFSADAFVLGGGYVVYPMKVEIEPGDNVAMILNKAMEQCGLNYESSGSLTDGFYLSRVIGAYISPSIESELEAWLEPIVSYYRPESWQDGSLGEFDFTDMSGWMFFVNGQPSEVGMSDCTVQDGDVISLRFSLAYGMDLGCDSFIEDEEPYVPLVNRDAVTVAIADGKLEYIDAADVLSKASAGQEEIDELVKNI